MLDLIKACETESELDFLQESFVLTEEQKEAVLQ
jgi:DNA gyrase/topoisomerase IV subunit A